MNKNNITIISIDPGVVTGYAKFIVNPICFKIDGKILDNIVSWECGQIDMGKMEVKKGIRLDGGEFRGVLELYGIIAEAEGCFVTVEDFIVRRFEQTRDFLAPVRITAALEQMLFCVGKKIHRIPPSDALGSVTDARLKDWGFWVNGKDIGTPGVDAGDARSALKHGLCFLRKIKSNPKLLL